MLPIDCYLVSVSNVDEGISIDYHVAASVSGEISYYGRAAVTSGIVVGSED